MNDVDAALQELEQNTSDRETSVIAVVQQAPDASVDQQAESLQSLRRRLDAKEEQLRALQRELRLRDERITQLERLQAGEHDASGGLTRQPIIAMGLVLESANDPSVKFRISRVTTTIGRAANNDIVLNFTSVSRLHARLVVASDSIYLIDVQSSNGCEVNGERISRQMLNNGDVVTIGDLKFKFATGVPLSELEDRSMDETQALLDESIVFTRVPTPKAAAEPKQVADGTPKTK